MKETKNTSFSTNVSFEMKTRCSSFIILHCPFVATRFTVCWTNQQSPGHILHQLTCRQVEGRPFVVCTTLIVLVPLSMLCIEVCLRHFFSSYRSKVVYGKISHDCREGAEKFSQCEIGFEGLEYVRSLMVQSFGAPFRAIEGTDPLQRSASWRARHARVI